MTTLREAAQQALEALEMHVPQYLKDRGYPPITALRAALAEPVQEPVAWLHVPHPDNGLRPVVSLSQQRESSLYGASVPLFIKEQL